MTVREIDGGRSITWDLSLEHFLTIAHRSNKISRRRDKLHVLSQVQGNTIVVGSDPLLAGLPVFEDLIARPQQVLQLVDRSIEL